MKHDRIVDGEAMSEIEGVDVTDMVGDDRERATFNAYRVAFRANEGHPNLKNAAALVRAFNRFADVMGISRV